MTDKLIVCGVPISETEFEIATRLEIPLPEGKKRTAYECLILYAEGKSKGRSLRIRISFFLYRLGFRMKPYIG